MPIMSRFLLAAAPLMIAAQSQTDHWAVLIAGSNTYGNYRHQADVCHAYQTITTKGIPPENIIVMAYDDIANNRENPFPGKVFNKPTAAGTPGVDVYAGCKIDWSGSQVTPENFVKVLTGDNSSSVSKPDGAICTTSEKTACENQGKVCCCARSGIFGCDESVCCAQGSTCGGSTGCVAPGPSPPSPGTGKVLGSGPNSRVFVNFVDHGGVGLIGFPSTTMHATELAAALKTMADKQMYKELVFYLEACESGSMFPDGSLQANMYATTAANAKESSWGTYCGADAMVDGKNINSCLGDLYSVNWMEDSDNNTAGETLADQFKTVQALTTKSHVTEFGDTAVSQHEVNTFQGSGSTAAARPAGRTAAKKGVDARDAELMSAYDRFMATESEYAADELISHIKARAAAAKRFKSIAAAVAPGVELAAVEAPEKVHMKCHYAAHKAYVAACGEWTTGALKHSASLAKLCEHTAGDAAPIRAAIEGVCKK